jgi:hypothetical protein
MLPYWLLFSAAALLALIDWPRRRGASATLLAILMALLLALFIGLRFRVGADWDSYDMLFITVNQTELGDASLLSDPAYSLLNWVVGLMGGDIWWVNLVCAILFSGALMAFCMSLPLPGVALLSATPSLIIVIAMGFTRQACSIACIMMAIRAYHGSFNLKWLLWLALGMAFHKSAIFALPIFMLSASRNRTTNLLIGAAFGVVMIVAFVLDRLQGLIILYVEGEMKSGGAGLRVGLAVGASILFFLFLNKSEYFGERYRLWRNMAIASLLLVPVFLLVESTTAIDRVAYSLLPFQIMVLSYLPVLLARGRIARPAIVVLLICFNGAILATWLLFAEHSQFWLPYRNVLFERFLY